MDPEAQAQITKKEDICTHLGDDYARFFGAIVPPIFQNSLFVRPNEGNGIPDHDYVYSRMSNPTTEIAEAKIAALENAEDCCCFSSGMAAISAAVLHFVKAGSHVVYVQNAYGGTNALFNGYLKTKFGIECTAVPGTDIGAIERALRPDTSLLYLESPSSFVFTVQDLEAAAKLAKPRGIGTLIDNSYATPLYQNPLDFGIDAVLHTASKYLGGHSDIVAGAAAGTKEFCDSLRGSERGLLGACMDPHQAWLLIRGIRTLPVRLRQHSESAARVAAFLESHAKVAAVYYPGLSSHPQSALIHKQMRGASGLLSFVPALPPGEDGLEKCGRFIGALRYFMNGCSWGGFESLAIAITPGQSEEEAAKAGLPANLIRLHIGLENIDTLLNDLENALRVF